MRRLAALPLIFVSLLLGCAEAQRVKATAALTFYAGPNGIDASNGCLSQSNPCTLQGAHGVALNNWDLPGCTIRLANGVYTSGVSIAGQYVGTHLCQVWGNVDQDGNCIDRTSVVITSSSDLPAFDVQDRMMTSIACLTVQGNGAGFSGRQHVVIDLADINCAAVHTCIDLKTFANANVSRDIWISGNSRSFAQAVRHSIIYFGGGTRVIATKPVALTYFAVAQMKGMIEFAGSIVNPEFLSGPQPGTQPQCFADNRTDDIRAGGMTLPCLF